MTNEKTAPRVFQPAKESSAPAKSETTLQKFMRVSGLPKRPAAALLEKATAKDPKAKQAIDSAKSPEQLVKAVRNAQELAGEDNKASIDTTEPPKQPEAPENPE